MLSHSQREYHWLVDLDWLVFFHFKLAAWAVPAANLAFYAALFCGNVVLYRNAQGKERVIVVCGLAVISLDLFPNLVSSSAAHAIDYVKATAALLAFLTAVDIFFTMPAGGYPRTDNQTLQSDNP
jgi:hypothetical protein